MVRFVILPSLLTPLTRSPAEPDPAARWDSNARSVGRNEQERRLVSRTQDSVYRAVHQHDERGACAGPDERLGREYCCACVDALEGGESGLEGR